MTVPLRLCCTSENNCWAADTEGEPCWGRVAAIDEDCPDDPELRTWVHGCEGHEDRFGKYKPEPLHHDRFAMAIYREVAADFVTGEKADDWESVTDIWKARYRKAANAVLAIKAGEK